jgi:uncharacterized repeat protein (TIGR01451 family)
MISSVAEPTNFSVAHNAKCSTTVGFKQCDFYFITLTNVGGAPSSGPIRIVDTLPEGLRPVAMTGMNFENEQAVGCAVATTTCSYTGSVAPGGTISISVELEVVSAAGSVTNHVRVEGGGAASAQTSAPMTLPNTVDGPAAGYGIAGFGLQLSGQAGPLDGQAADHPGSLSTILNLNTNLEDRANGFRLVKSIQPPRDLIVSLPPGFTGDPLAAAQCTAVQLTGAGGEQSRCPPGSRVGNVILFGQGLETDTLKPSASGLSALYNMVPEKGYPAEFAFKVYGKTVSLYPSLVHTSSGYALRVNSPGITRTIGVEGFGLTFFGDPNEANDEPNNHQAFFTNPSDCNAGPLRTKLETDSWLEPGNWQTAESTVYPSITGCSLLQFEPKVEMRPETTGSESPSGFEIKVKAPQNPNQFPVLATPDLRNITMTLPEGMTLAAGGAGGLVGCPATGEHGIDMPGTPPAHPNEAGEGEEIGADGLSHLSAGHCPLASRIGEVEIRTPVLKDALTGHVYVADPPCGGEGQPPCTAADAAEGRLFGIYLEAEGSGIVIKLAGRVSADPSTGRLTARFTELPQQPVSEVTVRLKGGPRAPLSNPRACGTATMNADIAPWGAPVTPDALTSAIYPVDFDGADGACPGTFPFSPSVIAGSASTAAGRFAALTFTLTRPDRNQDLGRIQLRTPPGLLGKLSSVTLCREPDAARGTCPAASRIGTVSVAVGPGSQPYVVNGGRVYLTESYAGSPFGLSIVVPAVAGPFNLGNVIVRSRIDVDPGTSALTVTSDSLPRFKDGVPLRIQTLNVTIDRPGFMFNPTSCARKQIATTLESTQGAVVSPVSPYAVEGCNQLPFKPGFKVSTKAKTSKANGASLTVRVTSGAGQTNIGKVDLQLPKALPARLTTLQKACTEAQFGANPAGCPAASVIGSAKAITPVLNVPLIGPAYLVSHGGAAFPDVEFILQGQGVRIDLDGKTLIKKGITYSRFETVPDAPISSFETVLPQGPHSVLATNLPLKARGSLCGTKLVIPTTLTGQNGAVLEQSTKVAVSGCAKVKKVKKSKQSPKGKNRRRP